MKPFLRGLRTIRSQDLYSNRIVILIVLREADRDTGIAGVVAVVGVERA